MEILVDGLVVLVDADRFAAIGSPCLVCYWDTERKRVRYVRIKSSGVALHRVLYGEVPADYVLDHINGNILDNRLCNLRLATPAQNARNSILGLRGASKYPNVSKNTRTGRWQVSLRVDKKSIHIGTFVDELLAAKAAKAASLKHHGEFSIYNKLFKEL